MRSRQGVSPTLRPGGDSSAPSLHNCGAAPREVYRTAAVGQTVNLDLLTLLARSRLPRALRYPVTRELPGEGERALSNGSASGTFISADHACSIATLLLAAPELAMRGGVDETRRVHSRHTRTSAAERARTAIAALAERLAELGWLAPFHGLATSVDGSYKRNGKRDAGELQNEWAWLPAGERHEVVRLAWSVCAISYLSPPLILWTRQPSLAWWRGDSVIALRWFGQRGDSATPGAIS